jgi:protein-S-isoprenylcysteine O-methyltransferase Ste14
VAVGEPVAGDPERSLQDDSIRKAEGGLSNFDEIVTPHPFIAFLFRRRTFIVLLSVLALVAWADPKPGMFAAGFAIALLSEAWRIWAAGTIHKTSELTTGGPYAHVRHPLYVGSFGHSLAYGLMSGRWESFLIVIPLFALLYGAALTTEEAMLRKLFPGAYDEYCLRVPRLLPRLTPSRPAHGRFDWKQVMLNKEYVNVIWVVAISGLFVLRLAGVR